MGMKKSVVAINAWFSLSKYTAASSAVSMPTNSSLGMGKLLEFLRISAKIPGAILQPQPPPCERLVKRGAASVVVLSGAFMVSFKLCASRRL